MLVADSNHEIAINFINIINKKKLAIKLSTNAKTELKNSLSPNKFKSILTKLLDQAK